MLWLLQGIREGIARLEAACNAMSAAFPASVEVFAAQFRVFHLVHTEHSRHEDTVIFPVMNAWFPNRAGQSSMEHVEHDQVHIVNCALTSILTTSAFHSAPKLYGGERAGSFTCQIYDCLPACKADS